LEKDFKFTEEEKDLLKSSERIIHDVFLACLEKIDPDNQLRPEERFSIAKACEKHF